MKKTIIVTGAAGNLGKTITENLLREGYDVVASIGPMDNPQFMIDNNLTTKQVDLLDENASRDFIHHVIDIQKSEVESLICLVGGFTVGNIDETSSESVQKMIDLNFKTTYHVVRPIVKEFMAKGKPLKIILIGSRPGLLSEEGKDLVAYSLSKSLIFSLADFINEDTNETGISASVIIPSTMDTPGTRKAMPDADFSRWVPKEQVYQTVSFILSEAGTMMRKPIYKLYNKA
ncbi:MAG: SDR family NAD(P)-dependent oxidoreductase [Bacteroidota bacterium]